MQRLPNYLLVIVLLVLCGCVAQPAPLSSPPDGASGNSAAAAASPDQNLHDGCVESYDPAVDYFPQKLSVAYASGFDVEYRNNYKIVTVTNPWQGAQESFRYLLLQCGTPAPQGVEGAVVEVPVKNIIAMSTTYLPTLEDLGLIDRLIGLDSYMWTTNPAVRTRIESGDVAEIGGGAAVNVELTLDLDPALVMTYGTGFADYDTHPVLLEAGIPVALNGDFVEQSPLGRAEWMKFIALFFNREADAAAQFDTVAMEYHAVAELAATLTERPSVLLGSVYNGTWYVAGGGSYMARLLADAGAAYLWSDEGDVGALPLDFESVYAVAAEAEFWLNPDNSFWFSVENVLDSDPRYGDFAPLKRGRMYNNNARVNENGGNAYYEEGAAHPERVLKDLVKILHPHLLPDHELRFYQQVQ
ncbi:MAG: ABC transporter substrate-binding protein [Caldilineaceae bacterium SB0661_bin_32]|uniref:ABC transporter substrate-binding protein n=1 Tax=Caldilineaceae bacterium SB0661_bin_32 TaxID=2605255 RepID=A0A6B1D8X4_9CHLR|nr:ABC transporter substrate-binding protein [Caldilineaceae bacterium SB0661_bin_32]